jgi:hypothetical protein
MTDNRYDIDNWEDGYDMGDMGEYLGSNEDSAAEEAELARREGNSDERYDAAVDDALTDGATRSYEILTTAEAAAYHRGFEAGAATVGHEMRMVAHDDYSLEDGPSQMLVAYCPCGWVDEDGNGQGHAYREHLT